MVRYIFLSIILYIYYFNSFIQTQFEPNCLDTALLLLKDLSSDNRRNAASVVERILSRIAPIDNNG